jgi:hypothetical protein
MEPEFSPEQISSMIKDVQRRERLARIERWAGMAMQVEISNPNQSLYFSQIAELAFNYAEAMEAEYQKRYNTKQDN